MTSASKGQPVVNVGWAGLIGIVVLVILIEGVLAASIAESPTARLTVFDSTDTGTRGVSAPISLFVTFSNSSSGQSINGSCQVSVPSVGLANLAMTFNGLGDGRYNGSLSPMPVGDHSAVVTCSAPGFGSLTASDMVSIRATANMSLSNPAQVDAGLPVLFSVLFTNASTNAIIAAGQCVMHFPAEAGEPLNPVMVFNTSTGSYEVRRSFAKAGSVLVSSNCTAPGFDPVGSSSMLSVREILPKAVLFADPATTNFSALQGLDNVQVTLANQHGRIRWLNPVNATLRDFDAFVRLANNMASVNVIGLGGGFNSSVEVVLFNAGSNTVVAAPGFFSTLAEVKAFGNPCQPGTQPACTEIAMAGSTVSFKASFPASFGLGADANLTMFAPQAIAQFTSMVVGANYTNASSGAPIANAAPFNGACVVSFSRDAGPPENGVMAFYEHGSYQFMRQFNVAGSFVYNATCESDPFALRQGNGSFIVVAVSAPPVIEAPPPPPLPVEVPPGPVPVGAVEPSPVRTLVATSGGLTTSLAAGEEVDVSVNQVIIQAGIEWIRDNVALSRLGSQRANISQGQELMMDVDRDGIPDVSLQLLGLSKDSAKVMIKKLREGRDEELQDESGLGREQAGVPRSGSGKKKPVPIQEAEKQKGGLSWWWFVLSAVVLIAAAHWYYQYNLRMKRRFL